MDYVWSPWRYRYISQAGPGDECIFCKAVAAGRDEETYIVHRADRNFVILNHFPYTNGHMMIAPYEHVPALEGVAEATLAEMMSLARRAEQRLREVYRAQGLNLGMNLGQCAGAGVAGHIHMHVLPRWVGDASFITVAGETRVLPEDLTTTYEKLRTGWR
jgi:ATP adenylyltransferase